MKNLLIFVIIIGIIIVSGTVFYNYVYLPQQDISAIRRVIAPTPAQRQVQQQQEAQSEAQFEKSLNDYFTCQTQMMNKESVWLEKQCPPDSMDMLKQMDCRGKAMSSAGAKQFDCPRP